MAYQTGTATNIEQLFTKLADFIVPLNWRIIHQSATRLYVQQGNTGKYWALDNIPNRGDELNRLYTMPCSAIDKDKPAFEQPGCPYEKGTAMRQMQTSTNLFSDGPFLSYDFFATPDYIHVVFEYSAGCFRHFGIGQLVKDFQFEGGEYAYGTWLYNRHESQNNSSFNVYGMGTGYDVYSSVLRVQGLAGETRSPWYFIGAQRDGKTDDMLGGGFLGTNLGAMTQTRDNRITGKHADDVLTDVSNSTMGQVVMPNPNIITARLLDGTFVRLGIVPDRYHVNMHGIIPRSVLTINGSKWIIIPATGYHHGFDWRTAELPDSSTHHGVAYRIVE